MISRCSAAFLAVPILAALAGVGLGETIDDLVFVHHSIGRMWLENGLESALTAKDYIDERNDVYYDTAMSPDSGRPNSLWGVPGDYTDMNRWLPWFNDYWNGLKTHGSANGVNRIVMFKPGFAVSDIASDGTDPGDPFSSTKSLANYEAVFRHPNGPGNSYTRNGYVYLPLEDVFAANPDTLFIAVTAPPHHPDLSSDANAHRARLFDNWLKQDWLADYNARHPGLNNVAVFDMFDVLAYPDNDPTSPNRLRWEYVDTGASGPDSHPYGPAYPVLNELFASGPNNFIDRAYARFAGSVPEPSVFVSLVTGLLAVWAGRFFCRRRSGRSQGPPREHTAGWVASAAPRCGRTAGLGDGVPVRGIRSC